MLCEMGKLISLGASDEYSPIQPKLPQGVGVTFFILTDLTQAMFLGRVQ